MINISQATIAKHSGWLALWPEKKRGVFCYYDEGVFKRDNGTEIEYEKIRLVNVYVAVGKKGNEYIKFMDKGGQKYRRLSFDKELGKEGLADALRKIVNNVCEDIFDSPTDESEIDKILKETGGVF